MAAEIGKGKCNSCNKSINNKNGYLMEYKVYCSMKCIENQVRKENIKLFKQNQEAIEDLRSLR